MGSSFYLVLRYILIYKCTNILKFINYYDTEKLKLKNYRNLCVSKRVILTSKLLN